MSALAAAVGWLAAMAIDSPPSAVSVLPLSDEEIAEARRPLPPKRLTAKPGRQTLALNGDARALFEGVAKAYGLDVVFDGEFQAGPMRKLRIEDADYQDALQAVEAATGSFIVPVGEKLFLAVKDTPQKRQDAEPTAALVVPIPGPVAVQDAQELARSVQQTIEIQKFVVDTGRRLVLFRDRVSKALAARELLEQLLGHKPTVSIEIEVLSTSRNYSRSLGLSLPTSFPLAYLGNPSWAKPEIATGINGFLTFGGGLTLFGIGVSSAQAIATMSSGQGRSKMRVQITGVDGQAASFLAGERYPILTAGYFGTTQGKGKVYAPPPSMQFEDLGVTLKVTPRVHSPEEVTLELEAEFKTLAGAALNGIPVISARKYQTRLRVGAGEWAVVSAQVGKTETRTRKGFPWLINLPIIGRLFGVADKTEDATEILMLIKPRVTSIPPFENPVPAFWVGTESRPRTMY